MRLPEAKIRVGDVLAETFKPENVLIYIAGILVQILILELQPNPTFAVQSSTTLVEDSSRVKVPNVSRF